MSMTTPSRWSVRTRSRTPPTTPTPAHTHTHTHHTRFTHARASHTYHANTHTHTRVPMHTCIHTQRKDMRSFLHPNRLFSPVLRMCCLCCCLCCLCSPCHRIRGVCDAMNFVCLPLQAESDLGNEAVAKDQPVGAVFCYISQCFGSANSTFSRHPEKLPSSPSH
jgi:hypothetical protein